MDNLNAMLLSNQVFSHLDGKQRCRIVKSCMVRRYQKDQIIALYGDDWPYLFMVGGGKVYAIKESIEGRKLIVTNLEPGDILWGISFYQDEAPLPVSFTACTDCCIFLWSRDKLLPVLLENGRCLWELTRLMVYRMQHASDLVEGLAFQSVAGRVARVVQDLFDARSGAPVARSMTLDEMAATVGTTREVVCRALYRMAEDEIIRITRTEFILTDENGLAKLAQQQ
ncbi:MAG: Crp/Fnr family transcriptional regulator [Anaerolineales bacterium]|nr:Crp/Fnr family transcriptional regulator [Anaerolineales bacterium]